MVVGRRSHHASLTKAKRVLKKENIRSPNDAWKGYLKTWDQTPQGGFTRPNMNPPQQQGANVLIQVGLWPMAIILNPSSKTEVSKGAWIKS